jgi:hypothetical protein
MAETYHPFDAGAGANIVEAQWRAMARHWVHGGSGVLATELNKLSTIGDSTGMQVKVDTGRAWVAGHFYENDAQRTLAIEANSSGNPRIDRVVVRADFTANTITATIIKGTPAGSPTAPAITQSTSVWDIPLAQVAVANGAVTIAAGNVTDERMLVSPTLPAMRVPSATARTLSVPSPVAGQVSDLGGRLEQYDGSAWQRVAWSTSAGRTGWRLRRAANQSIPNTTPTDISWDTEDTDTDGFITVTAATITVPTGLGGLYVIGATLSGPSWVQNAGYTGRVIVDGTGYALPASGAGEPAVNAPAGMFFPLNAGSTVTVRMTQTSGSAQNFTASCYGWRVGP